jgi:ketosteroid isomerase-like protein
MLRPAKIAEVGIPQLMCPIARLVVSLGLVTTLVTAQNAIPPDLVAMADTEREFARTATVKGWRDAFLEFFADDAMAFTPEVASAKDRLRKQPSAPFSEFELVWEPRTGDVAASGDLGWLTGPSTSINHKAPEKKPRYGCYLSIWRRQPDGRWLVFIDVGADSPGPVPFAPGFTRIPFERRYSGAEGKDLAGKSLAEADRDLNMQIAAQGLVRAFNHRLAPASRFHRPGTVPLIGRQQITNWLEQNAATGTATNAATEASAAADFGYSYGNFETKGAKPASGVYVRLWSRDAAGRWWLMVDVAQPFKQ